MPAFTANEWLILLLAFVLGLLIGMMLLAGNKWKHRYKEESRLRREDHRRIEELETENRRLAAATHSADEMRRSDAGYTATGHGRADDRVDRVDRVAPSDRPERVEGDRRPDLTDRDHRDHHDHRPDRIEVDNRHGSDGVSKRGRRGDPA